MITRIVKMQFRPEEVSGFIELFESQCEAIRAFHGCNYLALLQDANDTAIFFTHSVWDSTDALEAYRNSELFKSTWARTKALFAGKPVAWSTNSLVVLS